jgi:hypothetical protein
VRKIAPHLSDGVRLVEVALFRGTGKRTYSGGVQVWSFAAVDAWTLYTAPSHFVNIIRGDGQKLAA